MKSGNTTCEELFVSSIEEEDLVSSDLRQNGDTILRGVLKSFIKISPHFNGIILVFEIFYKIGKCGYDLRFGLKYNI